MRSSPAIAAALLAVAAAFSAAPARAQCASNASSCVSCHEAQGLRPVIQGPLPWHLDHGFGDLCVSCHLGDPAAVAKEAAHAGRRAPLGDPGAACGSCHPSDFAPRAERYAAARASTPPVAPPPPRGSAGAERAAASTSPWPNRLFALVALALAIPLGILLRRRAGELGLGVVPRPSAKTWSPYAAGALLGVVVTVSEVAFARPVAASGAVDRLAAYPGRLLFPRSQYYAHVLAPGVTWSVWVLLGVALGSLVSALLSGEARPRWLPDRGWIPRFGARRWPRLLIAFVGAALVQLGAGIAGGCTSGLAISGGAVLAPAAFLFMAGMFAGGIPTAWAWHRGGRAGAGKGAEP